MRALRSGRSDPRRQNYDEVGATLSLGSPRDLGQDPYLRLLFRPQGADGGALGQIADMQNMASGLSASTGSRMYRINNSISGRPALLQDTFGPYWNFATTSDRLIPSGAGGSGGAPMPWQTTAGHLPGTIASVFMLTSASVGEQYVFFIGGNTASSCGIGIGVSAGSVVAGKIFTRTGRIVSTTAMAINQPYAAVFTSRSTTDHEVVARNLITGAVLSATSALDSGVLAGAPTALTIGSQANLVAHMDRARIYMCAFWERAFTNNEMMAWASAPLAIMKPRIPALRFAEASSLRPYGPSVFASGGYSVFP